MRSLVYVLTCVVRLILVTNSLYVLHTWPIKLIQIQILIQICLAQLTLIVSMLFKPFLTSRLQDFPLHHPQNLFTDVPRYDFSIMAWL